MGDHEILSHFIHEIKEKREGVIPPQVNDILPQRREIISIPPHYLSDVNDGIVCQIQSLT